jgi:serine kinase of HPr protein (carbohydrate metabolism regulator)
LFVGERKSGKSTLAVDFVNQAGCQLLTDEIVYLHRRTLLVGPFPIAVGVKPPAWNMSRA